MKKKPLPKRDPQTGRFLARNRWHSPKAISHPDFNKGLGGPPPNDDPDESFKMTDLVYNYRVKYGTHPYEAHSKLSLDYRNPPDSKVPDVSIIERTGYDNDLGKQAYRVVVAIEIDNNEGEKQMVRKCKGLIKNFSVREAFFYNMDSKNWRKFTINGEAKSRKSYSSVLGINLNTLL